MKTMFEFRSVDFNCSVTKDYFINPGCYGDDVCRFLIANLRGQGIQTDAKPDQEDFGWFFNFRVGEVEHCLVVSFQPNDPATGDRWIGWVERSTGLIGSIFGARNRGIKPDAIRVIDSALRSSPRIHDVLWRQPAND